MSQKRLTNLSIKKAKLATRLKKHADIVQGSVCKIGRLCGNPKCQCALNNQRHINLFLSLRKFGKTDLVYVPKQLETPVKTWSGNYKRLMKLINEISNINVQILRIKKNQ